MIFKVSKIKYSMSTVKYGIKNKNAKNATFVTQLANEFANQIQEKKFTDIDLWYDRGGNVYCGLVKVFADSLRKNGIKI